jgi:hypothetical protein
MLIKLRGCNCKICKKARKGTILKKYTKLINRRIRQANHKICKTQDDLVFNVQLSHYYD